MDDRNIVTELERICEINLDSNIVLRNRWVVFLCISSTHGKLGVLTYYVLGPCSRWV